MPAWTRRELLWMAWASLLSGGLVACRGGAPPTATLTLGQGTPVPVTSPVAAATPAPTPTEAPRRGGILAFNLPGDPVNFDLHQAGTSTDLWCLHPCFDSLLQFDPNDQTKLLPNLAERWEVSPDGLVYTFSLRRGVQFHDGSPFTSRDVVVNFERIINPPEGINSPRAVFFDTVDHLEAPDDYTVRFVLTEPDPSLVYFVAIPWCGFYPAHLIESGADLREPQNIIGTGPFRFKNYTPSVSYELERNPNYFDPNLPYLDGIVAYPMVDWNAASQSFLAGQLHLYRSLTAPPLDLLESQPDVRVVGVPTLLVWTLYTNAMNVEAFKDQRVRLAISLALDREGLIAALTEGRSRLSGWMHPDGAWALPEERVRSVPGFGGDKAADIARAKQLLAEAGYPNGFDVELLAFNLDVSTPSYIADQLGQVGIRVQTQILQLGEYVSRLQDRAYQLVLGFNAPWLDEPKATFASWMTNDPDTSFTGLWSDELIALFARILRESDEEQRRTMVNELDYRTLAELSFGNIYVYRPVIWHVYRPGVVANWTPQPNYNLTEKHQFTWLRS